ncbi:MAG: efflux RND transporter permease subunit [Candidatus Buchananbacteria bacterium]
MDDQNNIEKKDNQSSDYLYLNQLKFNPELKKSWLNFFVSNFRVVLLLIMLLTIVGVYAFVSLPRESQPEVKIPIAIVATTYPGASPSDVEELISKKIETAIAGLKGIKKITSKSSNSISTVTVEFDAKANLDDSLRSLRDKVSDLKKDLPTDANDPIVKEISFDDTPIMTVSITGPYDGFTMRKYADEIKDELEKIPGVREVIISGGDQKEFEIAYDPQKLTFYSLSPDQVTQIIKATNLTIPAGTFEGTKFSFPIRADARFYDVQALGNIPLFHTDNGAIVYLKDVAEVSEKAINKTVYSRLSNNGGQPQPEVSLSIVKKTGGSIIDAADLSKQKIDEMVKSFPPGISYIIVSNTADQINEDFNQLTHDFSLTIILVVGILFLIVGLKEAIVAGMAVPLVFFATFTVMMVEGITLNFLSVFSLILALGLLVDDAIVVVSATKQYLKTGKFTPEEAVLLVLNDFKVVLLTTTLTTVWAFLPLLLSTGIIGEFIKSIPITVSVTLISSLIIALIINHPLAAVLERIRLTKNLFFWALAVIFGIGVLALFLSSLMLKIIVPFACLGTVIFLVKWYKISGRQIMISNAELVKQEWQNDELIKKKLKEQGSHDDENTFSRIIHGVIHFNQVLPIYEKYLRKILATKETRLKTLVAVGVLFVIAILLPITGIIQTEFFSASDFDSLYINIEAPTGLKLDETSKIVTQVETQLLQYKEISNFSTLVGVGSAQSIAGSFGNPSNVASITLKLKDKKDRKIKSYDLAEKIRKDLKNIQEATITVQSPSAGPPSGSAFEARIAGDDLQKLDQIAHELKPILASINGVADINISLKESPADYTFTLDPERLELYNLNAYYVGSMLRMAISGSEVTNIIQKGDEIKVIARFDKAKIPNLEAVQNLQILNTKKQPVFIKDVAKIELKPSVDTITRIDQKRVVLLSAGVTGKTSANTVLSEFQSKIKKYKLPSGYQIIYGGENEQNTESVMSILKAMLLAGLLIISTLVIQFNSFKKAIIILITIPLALIGVFFGLAITGINLSFPGLIGILALFGIVVKNAIILVDKINLNLRHGIEFEEAIIDAGKSRLEAIFITSICTIFGIIPITLSNETWKALGTAIIFGLMLSSFLTLFILPTLFMTLVKKDERL